MPSEKQGKCSGPVERILAGVDLIAQERQRQIEVEGWTAEHDDEHAEGELALAAALYASPEPLYRVSHTVLGTTFEDPWPWWNYRNYDRYNDGGVEIKTTRRWDKRRKHSPLRRLVIAGALIAAEIDRLQRGNAS